MRDYAYHTITSRMRFHQPLAYLCQYGGHVLHEAKSVGQDTEKKAADLLSVDF